MRREAISGDSAAAELGHAGVRVEAERGNIEALRGRDVLGSWDQEPPRCRAERLRQSGGASGIEVELHAVLA
jgi:hypothetical protein